MSRMVRRRGGTCAAGAIAVIIAVTLLGLTFVSGPLTGRAWAGTTGKIAGKVTKAGTREPLPGVNVLVSGSTIGAATDPDGEYVIPNLPPGDYSLRARLVGFKETVVNGVSVHSDLTTGVDFTMEETVVELGQEVVITARRPLVEKDNTSSSVVMESSEITTRPTSNVSDVLASLPGIDFSGGELQVRGASLNEVAVLVDGARSQNPLDRTSFVGGLSLRAIQEMNVIRGTFNAEYGEAQTGVFEITTKEGTDAYHFYVEGRYTPPGVKHWGPSIYDPSTPLYWENTHARHLQWWVDYPDQWVDPSGVPGNQAGCAWTPEQAYANYLATHQPLSGYDKIPGAYTDIGVNGPVPFLPGVKFFVSGNYNSVAPLLGNAYRKTGTFFNSNAKLTFSPGDGMKVTVAGAFNNAYAGWGVLSPTSIVSIGTRYAYNENYGGLPQFQFSSQSVKFDHTLDRETMYELTFSHTKVRNSENVFPGDPIGWDATEAAYDQVRAEDANGNPVIGAYMATIGYHTTGYFSLFDDNNDTWKLEGFYDRQLNKNWEVKTGFEATSYHLNHWNISKLPPRTDANVYHPYKGAAWVQAKIEFEGLIVNPGLRYDLYAPNDINYLNLFDPLNGPTEKSKTFGQLSPRLGIAHPIDEKTVLHFSYGHFFQGPPFGDYGEGNTSLGNLTRFVVDGTSDPWVLGNRNLKPEKKVSYEVGIERNFADVYLLSVTAYYQDITNTIRTVTVQDPNGVTYKTSGNGDYADARGVELYLRKLPSSFYWGYVNFTMRSGSNGSSGTPDVIYPDHVLYKSSLDNIDYYNPLLKAGLMLQSPHTGNFLAGVFDDILVSVEYTANFPNKHIQSDVFVDSRGRTYLRPVYQNTKLRVTKEFSFLSGGPKFTGYVEIDNLFNNKWINLYTFDNASPADRDRLAQSGFQDTPSQDITGVPYLEMQKYWNLPRSVVFGVSFEL